MGIGLKGKGGSPRKTRGVGGVGEPVFVKRSSAALAGLRLRAASAAPLVWDSPVLARGTETKGETERKAAGAAHLAVLCVDVLAVPLHYRPVDEQAPHDDDHFQHLPQGHLSKHTHVNVDAQTRESHAGHETLKGDALGALCGKAGGCPVGWHPECLGDKSRQAALP